MAKDEIRVKANSKKKKLFTLKERRSASLTYNRYSTVCLLFLLLRVRFFGRIQKRIYDPRSYGFFATNKTKNPKKDYFIMTR